MVHAGLALRHSTSSPSVPSQKCFAQSSAVGCSNSMLRNNSSFTANSVRWPNPMPSPGFCAKRPFAGPQQVLAYLSRYTHRVAISPRRLLALNQQNQTVTFAWKDYADGARHKTMTLAAKEFLRRFCLHLLPKAFVKIRHFGFLSNQQQKIKIAQARTLLKPRTQLEATQGSHPIQLCAAQPTTPPGRVCPHCGSDRLWLIEIVPGIGRRSAIVPTLDSS